MKYYLVDNGSLRADAWRNLQRVAADMAAASGRDVAAASLLHSDGIPTEDLDGETAVTLPPVLELDLARGERDFGIVPFFFGPTRAITRYLAEKLEALRAAHPGARFGVAPCLFDSEREADLTLPRILADRVRQCIEENDLDQPPVVLVDHGSPVPEVTRVRDYVAGQMSILLNGQVRCVGPASMERREGAQYKFNEPLLERRLAAPPYNSGNVVVCPLFLSPGRHAGPDGDIAAICRAAEANHPGLRTLMTGLVGTHEDILPLLLRRMEQASE